MNMWTLMQYAKTFMPEEFIHTVKLFERICKGNDTYRAEEAVVVELPKESVPEPAPEPEPELTLDQ